MNLDGFKAVNDTFGHAAGDEVLATVADLLRARLRESDYVARHGGDEFAAILLGTADTEATEVAKSLHAALRDARLGRPERPVSASIGMVGLQESDTASDVLRRADLAMYRSKGQRSG